MENIRNELIIKIGEDLIGCEGITPGVLVDLREGNYVFFNGSDLVYKTARGGRLYSGSIKLEFLPKVYRQYLMSCLRCWFMSAKQFFDLPVIPEA